MKKLLTTLLGCVMISSCASSKEPMSVETHNGAAKAIAGMHLCGALGYISPQDAADGIEITERMLQRRYTFDRISFQRSVDAYKDYYANNLDTKTCNEGAILIAQFKRRESENREARAEIMRSLSNIQSPKTTYCNRFGTQTMCTTY